MPRNRVVLIHGYSDKGRSFSRWREILGDNGFDATPIDVGNYVSLANEVTVKDIAEGFDRALRHADIPPDEPIDAIVHSTGMLVVRAWLTSYVSGPDRRRRLERLIALAPATFGSPLAHKGRSFLGALFKGSRTLGPDFMEAGDLVLDALELGSRFTWDLAHQDLLGEEPVFADGTDTPRVAVFCGDRGYGGLKKAINPDGSDGTVRWAGCPLNTRKIEIDLMVEAGTAPGAEVSAAELGRRITPWGNVDIPLIPVADHDHGSILREPNDTLVELVLGALGTEDRPAHTRWLQDALARTAGTRSRMTRWQQFVIRVVDERGDPISDWNIQLFSRAKGRGAPEEFDLDVHKYERDKSFRCFHVDLDRLGYENLEELHLKLIASSGSSLVAYHGIGSQRVTPDGLRMNRRGKWDAQLDLSPLLRDPAVKLFFPFTTTLVELTLNREPMPLVGKNAVFWFS